MRQHTSSWHASTFMWPNEIIVALSILMADEDSILSDGAPRAESSVSVFAGGMAVTCTNGVHSERRSVRAACSARHTRTKPNTTTQKSVRPRRSGAPRHATIGHTIYDVAHHRDHRHGGQLFWDWYCDAHICHAKRHYRRWRVVGSCCRRSPNGHCLAVHPHRQAVPADAQGASGCSSRLLSAVATFATAFDIASVSRRGRGPPCRPSSRICGITSRSP